MPPLAIAALDTADWSAVAIVIATETVAAVICRRFYWTSLD